jgi:hypothetical protein
MRIPTQAENFPVLWRKSLLGIEEIAITDAMVEVGLRVFADSGRVDECSEVDTLLVSEIYRAMYRLAPKGNCEK